MSYAADHAAALADLRAAGARVVFAAPTGRTHDPATGMLTGGAPGLVPGAAIRVRGNPTRYEALRLVESEAPTLLVALDDYSATVPLGAQVAFGQVTYTVRDVEPVAPDGTPIVLRVVVAR